MIGKMLNLADLQLLVPKYDLLVLLFYATWSGALGQHSFDALREAAHKYPQVAFFAVDIDMSPEICRHVKVKGVPTYVFYKKGESVGILEEDDEGELARRLEELTFRSI